MATPLPENQAVFSATELLEATGGHFLDGRGSEVRGVSTDARVDSTGKAFVALRGERFDGHAFLEDAVRRGARVLVVERGFAEAARRASEAVPDVRCLVVEDTLRALGDLARLHRRRWGGRVIAVGGSAGKTTTRSVLTGLFDEVLPGRVLSTRGNLNNRVGVPLTLLTLESRHELAVLELGTNQPGEMAELGRIAAPDLALLTLIDLEHTEGLGDLDGVEREEGDLFQSLGASGVALGFTEDARVARQLARAPTTWRLGYGVRSGDFARLVERQVLDEERSRLTMIVGERTIELETTLLGEPGVIAVLAGMSVLEALFPGEIDGPRATRALASAGEPGRATLLRLPGDLVVLDDTYNSNPRSAEASVRTGRELANRRGGRLFVVLGEMLELGRASEAAHRALGELLAGEEVHRLVGVRGDAKALVDAYASRGGRADFVEESADVAALFAAELEERDVVVVKASRGVRAERVVRDLESIARSKAGPSARSEPRPAADPEGSTAGESS